MKLLSRNMELGPALKVSPWRKIALNTWKASLDPAIYGVVNLDMKASLEYLEKIKNQTGKRITVTHLIGRIVAEVFSRHPDINCALRLGRLYPRKSVDVFYLVATDFEGKDLTGTLIRNADLKSVVEIASEMEMEVRTIREQGDPAYRKIKTLLNFLPLVMIHSCIKLMEFLMYTLNIWTPLFGYPKNPFGSVMITSLGSLDLDEAFAPLVPYSRVPAIIAVGAVRDTPVVKDGKIQIAPVLKLCATMDHRVIDGVHVSQMVQTLKKIAANPELEIGNKLQIF